MKFTTNYHHAVSLIAAGLLLIYPTLMLQVKGGMNGVMLAMLLLALLVWIKPPHAMRHIIWHTEWKGYILAMFALSVATLFSQLVNDSLAARSYDAVSRYWLALPVFWLLMKLPAQTFRLLEIGFPLAAMLGLALAQESGSGITLPTIDKIHYGDYLMLFGVLSLLSLNWFEQDRWTLQLWKLAGFAAGMLAAIASGTRGALLALPVFIAICLFFRIVKTPLQTVIQNALLGIIFIAIFYVAGDTTISRLQQLAYDVSHYEQGELDTSTGIRWQLYKAALELSLQHPLAGVGPQGFEAHMEDMEQAGKITPEAATLGRAEVHNDILSKTVGMGAPGLLAILALYGVPLALFWKKTKASAHTVRRSAILGLALVAGHIMFGLTVEFLNLTMTAAFYGFSVAVLLAACYHPELNVQKE